MMYTTMTGASSTIIKKRITIFSITYHPFIGGAEVAIAEVSKRLSEYEFDLFTARLDSKLPQEENIGNVRIFRVGSGRPALDKLLYPFRAARLALKRHRQNPYDIIHAVLETYAGLAALLFKKRQPSVPYILTLQSGDSDWWLWSRTWFWYPLYRQIYVQADKITAISRWLANRARRYGYQGDIKIIPNGVDWQHFSGKIDPAERQFIRRSWGISADDFVVVTASRLVRKNGVDILIDALSALAENVKLVIVGAGEEENKLKFQVSSFKLQDRVIFLGQIDHQNLPRVLKSADAFVRPSRSEGLGNAFLEAMAAGLPAVGTKVGGIVDFMKDNATGLLVEPNNAQAVASAITALISDEKLRRKLANNGRALAGQRYDWTTIASQYQEVYESL